MKILFQFEFDLLSFFGFFSTFLLYYVICFIRFITCFYKAFIDVFSDDWWWRLKPKSFLLNIDYFVFFTKHWLFYLLHFLSGSKMGKSRQFESKLSKNGWLFVKLQFWSEKFQIKMTGSKKQSRKNWKGHFLKNPYGFCDSKLRFVLWCVNFQHTSVPCT